MDDEKDFVMWTVSECAAAGCMSIEAARKLIERNRIPRMSFAGSRRVLIRRADWLGLLKVRSIT
jgi:hypothetical protein